MSHPDSIPEPTEPDLPQYVLDAVGKQGPDRLETIAQWAGELAEYKRRQRELEAEQRREEDGLDEDELKDLEEQDVSLDPEDHDVPSGAYITTKETKPGYEYYYFQWREGDSWKNEYIAPVNPKE